MTKKQQILPRVVIIGGGFSGISLIYRLKNKPFEVILIDRQNHHNFQPLMYQVATCGLSTASIATPFRRLFRGYRNFTFYMAEVTRIVPEEKKVITSIGDIAYDYLVIATGSETNFFGNENFARNSLVMKSLDDAINIRNTLLEQFEQAIIFKNPDEQKFILNFIIIGGGATGVELAGALAEFRRHIIPKDYPTISPSVMNIHLIEAEGKLLPAMTPKASEKAAEFLTRAGVKIWLFTKVKNYDGVNVELTDGTVLRSAFFIWAAGVRGKVIPGLPDTAIKWNRIQVDEFNHVAGYSDIFAMGDAAMMATDNFPKGHPLLALPAIQQGANLGKNLVRLQHGQPLKKFKYFDLGVLATVGRNKAVADLPFLKTQGQFAWFLWMAVHLFRITGFRNRIMAFSDWIWNYFTYAFTYRIITRPDVLKWQVREQ